MYRNDAPGSLHHDLHHECADGETEETLRIGPEGNDRQAEDCCDDNGAAPANALRKRAKQDTTRNGTEIGDDREDADLGSAELMLAFQEGWIEILRSVAESVEASHQHNNVKEHLPITADGAEYVPDRVSLALPDRRFLDIPRDEYRQQRRRCADHEHAFPT